MNSYPIPPFFLCVTLAVLVNSCGYGDQSRQNSCGDESVTLTFLRLDQDLFGQDSTASSLADKKRLYGEFIDRYIEDILLLGRVEDPLTAQRLSEFKRHPQMRQLYQQIGEQFGDLSAERELLSNAFSCYAYLFPSKIIPAIIPFVSAFNYNVVVTDSAIGLGLDMYLGGDHPFYRQSGMPKYMTRTMTPEFVAVDAVSSWISTEFATKNKGPVPLIDRMIEAGKQLALLDRLLPAAHDTLKIKYTASQLDWCRRNERIIWAKMIEENAIFSSSEADKAKYLGNGPFTAGFPKSSPSRIGAWIGWRIVDSYTKAHPVEWSTFMGPTDAQQLLNQSGYRPGN